MSDLNAYYIMRTQYEAMTSSSRGRPDLNIEETRNKLMSLQGPYQYSHVYFGIFLKNDDGSEVEFIGDGGIHKFSNTDTE